MTRMKAFCVARIPHIRPRGIFMFRSRARLQQCARNQAKICALFGWNDNSSKNSQASSSSPRRDTLMEFISTITLSPDSSSFQNKIPAPVIAAMRQTVSNLLGTLPPQFFRITIQTRNDNLAQLMFSVLMTGYLFSNAHCRMQLTQSLNAMTPALIGATSTISTSTTTTTTSIVDTDINDTSTPTTTAPTNTENTMVYYSNDDIFAAGSQKIEVNGSILKWHHEEGVLRISAEDYIDQLEQELVMLKQQLDDMKRVQHETASVVVENDNNDSSSTTTDTINTTMNNNEKNTHNTASDTTTTSSSSSTTPRTATHSLPQPPGNELLDFLKQLSAEQVSELTECASPDVLEAMNALVSRMIDTEEGGGMSTWSRSRSECTATELAQLLYWLMMVGHELRDIEVRSSLVASLQGKSVPSGSLSVVMDDDVGGSGDDDDDFRRSWGKYVPRLPSS